MVRSPCPICQTPMTGRKRSACSGKCRAALSRKRREEALLLAVLHVESGLARLRSLIGGEEETA